MASGDTVFSQTVMAVTLDQSEGTYGTTQLTHSNGNKVLVEKYQTGMPETVFDSTKTYDVTIKEH